VGFKPTFGKTKKKGAAKIAVASPQGAKNLLSSPATKKMSRATKMALARRTEGTKPRPVAGLASSRLKLTKKKKKPVVAQAQPMKFAAESMLVDDHWADKQERGFTRWLNHTLNPPLEADGLSTFEAKRAQMGRRRAAWKLYSSDECAPVLAKIAAEIESKK
jgi:hypothetical protein